MLTVMGRRITNKVKFFRKSGKMEQKPHFAGTHTSPVTEEEKEGPDNGRFSCLGRCM